MSELKNYNELFAKLQKHCEWKNCGNAFSNITLEELIDLNHLLDRLLVYCDNVDQDELEDSICGDDVLNLCRLVDTLFDKAFIKC